VFVNPTQFAAGEDFDRYPRDLERDLAALAGEGADVVFAPETVTMYPRPPRVEVGFGGLERAMCGATRPGHFAGVGLVVLKLLHVVEPEIAVFGQKDAQQVVLVRRLVTDLDLPVRLVVAPTVREPDGLAMSSRNIYLTAAERRAAPVLYRSLERAARTVLAGEREPAAVTDVLRRALAAEPQVQPEYAVCVDPDELDQPVRILGPVLLAVAARLGRTRLIDNLEVVPPEEARCS
jgi:pantoate--beta-alanine ligase